MGSYLPIQVVRHQETLISCGRQSTNELNDTHARGKGTPPYRQPALGVSALDQRALNAINEDLFVIGF